MDIEVKREEDSNAIEVSEIGYTWQCTLFRLEIIFKCKKPPNFFWRWMQYLCFGNKWEKIK
jgi:hypothetical protein